MNLRNQVEKRLNEHRAKLEKQLAAITGQLRPKGKVAGSFLTGRKVPPKYRSPSGESWAGRGARSSRAQPHPPALPQWPRWRPLPRMQLSLLSDCDDVALPAL